MTTRLKSTMQQLRKEMQKFKQPSAPEDDKSAAAKANFDFIAEMFGEDTAKALASKTAIGYKDSAQGNKQAPDFWAFAKSTDKPQPSPIVSQYTDPFWQAFLDKE